MHSTKSKSKEQENLRIFDLQGSCRESIREYLAQHNVSTGVSVIDQVLGGGVEAGNFYLWLGSSKGGKSTTLRCLGLKLAENFPVLYVNFEQLGRNVFAKLYEQIFNVSLREEAKRDLGTCFANVMKLPKHPFYIAFWPDELEVKAFRQHVEPLLRMSIDWLRANDKAGRTPVIILENLSDIYNERMNGDNNLVNIVTQTAQDIKNFCLKEKCSIFLAHHTNKLAPGQKRPSMDDVRDSKRIVDLAHSIFTAFVREDVNKAGEVVSRDYRLAYLAGRGQSDYEEWGVQVTGLDMILS